METVILKIDSHKKEFFLSLMEEFSFIKDIKMVSETESEYYQAAIALSEQDFKTGNFKTHDTVKNTIAAWRSKQ